MNKTVKRVLLGVGLLPVVLAGAMAARFYGTLPRRAPPSSVKISATPEMVARGDYLANHVMGCLGCHSQVDDTVPGEPVVPGRLGSGRDFGRLPGYPGHPRAPNLTPDPETGIGNFTDGELLRAMREGIGRDGRPLFPMMPFVTYAAAMSDADAHAVIAYLRTLKPIKNAMAPTELDFPVSMFLRAVPKPLAQPAPPPPPESDVSARGRWLLKVASCADCHDSVDARHVPIPGRGLAGGQAFPLANGGMVYAANITQDKATGIGAYSEEDILRVLTEGKGKSGRPLYTMPWRYYAGMTDGDKKALVVALRETPAVSNVVPAPTLK